VSAISARRVLHVLPHPGGGGETYVALLAGIEGYAFETLHLARRPEPSAAVLANALRAQVAAYAADVVHVHGEIAAALCLPVLALRPSVLTLHGSHVLRRAQGLARQAARAQLALAVRAASRTICVSRSEQAEVIEILGGWAAGRTALVPNGVPLAPVPDAAEWEAARTALGIERDALVGACVGALDAHKDPLTAARAARGACVTLLMAGDGPLRDQLAREGAPVRLLGQQADVRRVLAAADFFVLASRREGLSFALLEAMACGLAPVVSDAPGNAEAVGDAGVVVPFGDVAGFAAAFARMRTEKDTLGNAARQRVAACYSADEMRRLTREVYDAAIAA
jgi:glycosyltransferase involved in cell wall biosynthesis